MSCKLLSGVAAGEGISGEMTEFRKHQLRDKSQRNPEGQIRGVGALLVPLLWCWSVRVAQESARTRDLQLWSYNKDIC